MTRLVCHDDRLHAWQRDPDQHGWTCLRCRWHLDEKR